ncbi:hypothetical protein KHA94_08025 [Bacillus sp. FJAT-49705]|uniref:Uncharacterized protein n=1 Tax=Cytobacillus citreus TaxID=2833586 RepID=A0ABS5NQQ0_9BACI|nr:hypothetical protein [Cytobacillus citreus]MBS4190151.1 hypothetical protein [Cytobacillus citreus]
MVPRSSRYKKRKKMQRKKMLKNFTTSVAISSILLGSAQITRPTYGEFNSRNDQDSDIQACFIFPRTVEEYRDRTYELQQETEVLINDALAKLSELDISTMNEKLDALNEEKADEEGATPPDFQADTSTIEGLQALQSQLQSEIIAIQNTIAANEQQIAALQEIITEVQELITKLEEIVSTVFPEAKEQAQLKLDEMIEIIQIIEEIKDRAIQECKFDPEFFNNILEQMNMYKAKTEELILKLDEELVKTEELIQEMNEKATELNDNIEALQTENEGLLAKIVEIESQIAAIDQQIATFRALQAQKEGLKEGTASLIQKLKESTSLTEEQIKQLIEKLTGVIGEIDKINLGNQDVSAIEKAIAEIEKEMKQKEEEARLEKERLEKEKLEKERLEQEEKEKLEQEQKENEELEQEEQQEGEEDLEEEKGEGEEAPEEEEKEDGEELEEENKEDQEKEEGGSEKDGQDEQGQNEDEQGNDQEDQDKPGKEKPVKEDPKQPNPDDPKKDNQEKPKQEPKASEPKDIKQNKDVDTGNKGKEKDAINSLAAAAKLMGMLSTPYSVPSILKNEDQRESNNLTIANSKLDMRIEEESDDQAREVTPGPTISPV